MLATFFFGALREFLKKVFGALPPLPAGISLPTEIGTVRYSLMRALQGVQAAAMQQFGASEPFEYFTTGYSALHPVMAKALIKHGWVSVVRPHWVAVVVQYRLSPAGIDLKNELEAWWGDLSAGQRLRAALLE